MTTSGTAVNTTAVSVQNVRKVYQRDTQEIKVLDGINLDVPQGEFVALMGPSGSGKTTLLNLIAGIDRVTSGKVNFARTDLTPLSEGELASVAQPQHRLHLSVLLSHSRTQCRRECRAAAAAHFPVVTRTPRTRHDRLAHRRTG